MKGLIGSSEVGSDERRRRRDVHFISAKVFNSSINWNGKCSSFYLKLEILLWGPAEVQREAEREAVQEESDRCPRL